MDYRYEYNYTCKYTYIRIFIIGSQGQEAKKSNNQLFVSWSTRKAGGIIQSESVGREAGSHWCKSRVPRPYTRSSNVQGEETMDVPAQEEKENSSFLDLFVSFKYLVDWMMPSHNSEGKFFIHSTGSNANALQKYPHRHTQK